MYVDIDQQGEVSLAKMTIKDAMFLHQILSLEGCCPKCTAKAGVFARIIHDALDEYRIRQMSGVDATSNIPDMAGCDVESTMP